MFFGCLTFWFPAVMHFRVFFRRSSKRSCWADLPAGICLAAVGLSSPICDAFLDYSGPLYADPFTGRQFPLKLVRANDVLNSASRVADRFVCIFVFIFVVVAFRFVCQYPEIFYFQRLGIKEWFVVNWHNRSIPLLLWFALAVVVCQTGQYFRKQNPCDVECRTYQIFSIFHTMWHILLSIGFIYNCMHRRADPAAFEEHELISSGVTRGMTSHELTDGD